MKCATLGELCSIERSGIKGYGDVNSKLSKKGSVPVIGSGRKPRGFHSEWNVEANSIIISRKGSHGQVSRYETNVFVTDDSFYLTGVSAVLDQEYLYRFLTEIVPNKLKRKVRDKSVLSVERLSNILVVYPSIHEQKMIAAYFDGIDEVSGVDELERTAVEPEEISKIREVVRQSNRDIVHVLGVRKSLTCTIFKFSVTVMVVTFAIFTALYMNGGEDENVSQWMDFIRNRCENFRSYFDKIIPMSCV